ncbi:MAG: riboflavin synthase [Gammaproteobacteria bacterium]
MFTGIIEAIGEITAIQASGASAVLSVDRGTLPGGPFVSGESIAVNGVCLTVTGFTGARFHADASRETLALTTLGSLRIGARVNLERALAAGARLGGHLVSGHVDGAGQVLAREAQGGSERFTFRAPAELARYIARKGSIAIDGVSLTVNAVRGADFDVQIIAHTAANTVISGYRPGDRVNLEVDIIARYLERLLTAGATPASGVTHEALMRAGFAGAAN